jgi:hypothetical protein
LHTMRFCDAIEPASPPLGVDHMLWKGSMIFHFGLS